MSTNPAAIIVRKKTSVHARLSAICTAQATVGDGAYVASGSVITEDVGADALAFGRARQETKPGYAPKVRAKAEAIKAARKARG